MNYNTDLWSFCPEIDSMPTPFPPLIFQGDGEEGAGYGQPAAYGSGAVCKLKLI